VGDVIGEKNIGNIGSGPMTSPPGNENDRVINRWTPMNL
jgi:hypothetical protein